MTREEVVNFFQGTGIEKKDFVIIGESAHCMRNLVRECNVISILVNREAMERLKEKFQLVPSSSGWCTLKTSERKVNILLVEKFQRFEMLEDSLYQVEAINVLSELYFSKKPKKVLAKNNVNILLRLGTIR